MYRGTTPQIKLKLDTNLDLSDIVSLWVTFKGISFEVTKTLGEALIFNDLKEIRVDLTQEETLKLKQGKIQVQVRFRLSSGRAYASSIAQLPLNAILKEGVI